MDILLNVESVTSQYHLKSLCHLYDIVESNIRSLGSLGISSDSYGSMLVSVLIQKLLQELRLIISRKMTEGEWSLVAIEIDARERT